MNIVFDGADDSFIRVFAIEDHLARKLSLKAHDDHNMLRALILLTLGRLDNFIRDNRDEIDIFAPNAEDRFLQEKCRKNLPDRRTFERAAAMMKELDQFPTGYGKASLDEVWWAVTKVARWVSVSARW